MSKHSFFSIQDVLKYNKHMFIYRMHKKNRDGKICRNDCIFRKNVGYKSFVVSWDFSYGAIVNWSRGPAWAPQDPSYLLKKKTRIFYPRLLFRMIPLSKNVCAVPDPKRYLGFNSSKLICCLNTILRIPNACSE